MSYASCQEKGANTNPEHLPKFTVEGNHAVILNSTSTAPLSPFNSNNTPVLLMFFVSKLLGHALMKCSHRFSLGAPAALLFLSVTVHLVL